MTDYFAAHGSSLAQAQQQAIAWIGQQVQAQASFLAYMDVFWVLMLISLAAVPLALMPAQGQARGLCSGAHRNTARSAQCACPSTDYERYVSRLLPMLRDARVARSSA